MTTVLNIILYVLTGMITVFALATMVCNIYIAWCKQRIAVYERQIKQYQLQSRNADELTHWLNMVGELPPV